MRHPRCGSSLVALCVTVIGGCSRLTAPHPGLVETFTLSRQTLVAGDTVVIEAALVNRGERNALVGADLCFESGFVVRDAKDSVVAGQSQICLAYLSSRVDTLAPGARLELGIFEYDGTTGERAPGSSNSSQPSAFLPAGSYEIASNTVGAWDVEPAKLTIVAR